MMPELNPIGAVAAAIVLACTAVPSAAVQARAAPAARDAASPEVRRTVDWVMASEDHDGRPFAVVDKQDARVFIFGPDGRLQGQAPALLGAARGDDSVPGVGDLELADIPPEHRTTPAGRFRSVLGRNISGREVLWVDYESAVSLHPVITSNPAERRPQRLATPTPADNRISNGCINVPAAFFRNVVRPAFARGGTVYVLPEERPLHAVLRGRRRG